MSLPARTLLALLPALAPEREGEAYLGIHTAAPAFAEDELALDPDMAPGLAVTQVVENSPAAQAGFALGDRVLLVNGEAPRTPEHLEGMVAALPPGAEVRARVRRGEQVLDLTAATVPRLVPRKAPEARTVLEGRRLGLALVTLGDEEGAAVGLAPGEGVLVRRILEGSPAADSGLEPGDLIVRLNGKGVHGADDLLALAREVAPGAKVTLVVARGEERREVAFRARDPEGYVAYFHFPGVVIYEHDARKDATTFGVILNIFKYTRVESRRTYRFFWVVSLTTGTNEELREVAE